MRKFKYNMFDEITSPTLILSTKYHKHIGSINNVDSNIASDFNMASHQEISFDVYKTLDGEPCTLWDQIVDFKYLYVPEHNEYYELTVSIDDADNTIKHCVGISAGEQELSQRYLRDFHCNDETDILMDDYVVTVFYNPNDPKGSLLDRVLHDKCPDWSIGHVDGTIANIQRTFTADNTTIYDFLVNTVATEIGCLFKFDSVNKKINAYDLKNTCADKCNNCEYVGFINETCPKCGSSNIDHGCGFRGEFTDKCPKCGKKHYIRSYGAWKNVYVSPENTALQITVDGDSESVKNCFKIVGGDDLMTATVVNINPNHSSYIYRFSDDMKADMPTELVKRLDEYEAEYRENLKNYTDYTNYWYDEIDQVMEYQTRMMPETPIPQDTTAKTQLDNLVTAVTDEHFAVSVQDINVDTLTIYNNSVEGYAKVLVDPRYTVEVSDGAISSVMSGQRVWTGKFTVKSLGGLNAEGKEDTATTPTAISLVVNDDFENFLQQKIQKSLDRKDAAFITIFNIENDNEFKAALKLYSLDRLSSFSNTYQSVLEILIKQKVNDPNAKVYTQTTYNEVYVPYYNRKGWIDAEMGVRENEVNEHQAAADTWDEKRKEIQTALDLETYLGEDLYKIFVLYLREDTYSNSNYISDGLDNAEEIEKARELFTVAESELIKASELQFTLTGQLANFLNTEEFKDFKDEFEIGDWIICRADDHIYRLRIINVNYSYDDPENIQITFSNVIRGGTFMSDVASILSKAGSMATSYNYVAHQANQGNNASNVIDGMLEDGVNTGVFNIIAGNNQDVIIDEHGITAKEYDDVEMAYSPKQLKITSRYIAFTDDNWAHSTLGLGEQDYIYWDEDSKAFVESTGYGISAKFMNAGYIKGSQIIAGEIISDNYDEDNEEGAYIDLNDGYFTFADGKLKFDGTDLTISAKIDASVIDDATITNSSINNGNFIVSKTGNVVLNGTVSGTAWATKQDKLTAGDNVSISAANVISAVDTTYTAGENITIDENNVISATGGSDYEELTREEYNALTDAEKNNGSQYFVKDMHDIEWDDEPTYVGELFQINNDMLSPDWTGQWAEQPRFFFNGTDCRYCYNNYSDHGYNDNRLMHPEYNHGGDSSMNIYIIEGAPVETHYCAIYHCIYGLNVTTVLWFPKDLIDSGQATLCLTGFYSTVPCEILAYHVWNNWDTPSAYSSITTYQFAGGFTSLSDYIEAGGQEAWDKIWFCNCPLLCGMNFFDFNEESEQTLLDYLSTREDNYPTIFQGNYLLYRDNIMLPYEIGTLMLNSVDYTGRPETEPIVDVMVDGTSVVEKHKAYIDLTGKQDVLTAGDNITIENNVISATSNTEYNELTQAEYNALTQEEKMNGTLYFITDAGGGGGGGSSVVPNPQGTPTDTLNTIGIDDVIYDIAGSGGGGTSGGVYTETVLWEDPNGLTFYPQSQQTITLSESIDKFDLLYLDTTIDGDATYHNTNIVSVRSLYRDGKFNGVVNIGGHQYNVPSYAVDDTTHLTLVGYASANPMVAWKVVGIKVSGNYFTPQIYSLEERGIGTWVDDKPLYAKTVSFTAPSGSGNHSIMDVSGLDIDSLINIEGKGSYQGYLYTFPTRSAFFAVEQDYLKFNVSNDDWGGYTMNVTLLYTKTTDVAGSGSYNSLAVPMLHYDNTEKIVGTYFGKTLYEKSYQNIAGTGTMVNVTLSDLSNIETIFIVPEASASTDVVPFPYVHYDSGNLIGGFFSISNGVPTLNVRRGSSMADVGLKYLTVRYTKTA